MRPGPPTAHIDGTDTDTGGFRRAGSLVRGERLGPAGATLETARTDAAAFGHTRHLRTIADLARLPDGELADCLRALEAKIRERRELAASLKAERWPTAACPDSILTNYSSAIKTCCHLTQTERSPAASAASKPGKACVAEGMEQFGVAVGRGHRRRHHV